LRIVMRADDLCPWIFASRLVPSEKQNERLVSSRPDSRLRKVNAANDPCHVDQPENAVAGLSGYRLVLHEQSGGQGHGNSAALLTPLGGADQQGQIRIEVRVSVPVGIAGAGAREDSPCRCLHRLADRGRDAGPRWIAKDDVVLAIVFGADSIADASDDRPGRQILTRTPDVE